jgi:hypothetical protein
MKMISSKKPSKRRVKSSSPIRNNNKSNIYTNKKKDNILAIEESKKLYLKFFSNPSTTVTNQLKGEDLKIYLNKLNPKDISVLSIILSKYYYFKSIEIASSDPTKTKNYDPNMKKREKIFYQNEKERKSKENEKNQIINKILASIGKNLFSSKKISNISLYNLTIDKKVSENISQGMSRNKSLQNLSIKNCKIPIDSYEILLKGLLSHEGIKFIDLSNNNFSDKYGNMISRIISRQAQRRDQVIWSYGLRNEFPDTNEFTKGLISINLHGNKLGDESTEVICSSLCSDQYIRAIDLSDNFINNDSCKKYIYMMRKNNTLLTIDLRNNPGYDENIHSRLVMKMSKNIHFLYQQYQSGGYTDEEFENLKDYIEISFFDVDIPQEIVEFYNENLPEEEENSEGGEENGENENNDIQGKDVIGVNDNKKNKLANVSTN